MPKKPRISAPPDDGREWILADEAAKLLGIQRKCVLERARKFQWICHKSPQMQTWILKSEVVWWHNFLTDRQRWYQRRHPKTWMPIVSVEPREAEADFPRYWWTSAQAAAFMGVAVHTIHVWTKQGRIPMFTTRKRGRGGKYWYSPTALRALKASEEWQRGRAIWEKTKETMRQGIVAREAYIARHPPYIYQGIPPGWITMREVAERLNISRGAAYRLRKMNRFMSEQFVGAWDAKNRPWFCHEESVERFKNSEEYQTMRQHGLKAIRTGVGISHSEKDTEFKLHTPQIVTPARPELSFGYTREELRMPRLKMIGIDEMW